MLLLLHTNWMNGILYGLYRAERQRACGARPHRASWQRGASYPTERQHAARNGNV